MNQLVMHRLLVSSQFASRSMDGPIPVALLVEYWNQTSLTVY